MKRTILGMASTALCTTLFIAGANAATVGWIAEVAGRVELGVQRLAAGGRLLEQVADVGDAAALDGGPIEDR